MGGAGVIVLFALVATSVADTQFLHIGDNNILHYNSPGGVFGVWKFEKEAVGKCNPFPTVPTATGVISNAAKIVYLGGTQVLHVEEDKGSFDVMTCSVEQKENAPSSDLKCAAVLTGSLSLFATKLTGNLAFSAPNSLLEFNPQNGTYYLYKFTIENGESITDCSVNDDCRVAVKNVAAGSLAEWCGETGKPNFSQPAYHVAGLSRSRFVAACKDRDQYVVTQTFHTAGSNSGVGWTREAEGTAAHLDIFSPLGNDLVLVVDPDTLGYDILDCVQGCVEVSSGSFTDGAGCSYTHINQCVDDPKCGFCVDTGKCREIGNNGPCFGSCQKFISQANSTVQSNRVPRGMIGDRQVVYMGRNTVLQYVSARGAYNIYSLEDNHPSHAGKCPSFSTRPIFSGNVAMRDHVALQYHNNSVLFYNPANGAYTVWACSSLATKAVTSTPIPLVGGAPCSVVARGTLGAFKAATAVMSIGNYVVIVGENGVIQIFEERDPHRRVDEMVENIFKDSPSFLDHKPELTHHSLVYVGNNHVFDLDKTSGEYRIWILDSRRGVLLGPSAHGTLPAQSSSTLAWMGDDRLLVVDSAKAEYFMMRFDTEAVAHGTAISFTTTGRGNLDKESCDYGSCSSCVEDKACGWCATLQRCLPGNRFETCNDNFKCFAWTYGYCAADACSNQLSKEECVAVEECGWCAKQRTCVPRKGANPLFGDCLGPFLTKDSARV